MAVTVKPHQCLFDIILRESGAADAIFLMAQANDISITDELTGGATLQTTNVVPINKSIISYYQHQQIFPGTSLTLQSTVATRGGIGYMGIGIDFKIS
ncbi:hypothetical protein CLV59_109153 [Chitinophaga dinghuensis]|uniref:Uncharacterized protein n=1 Tax=Chitinophaga dinghuensis TaxID=1539050 RepID=A0A327VQ34_9BACT|nr:hypothetical protein [Chitinophaga dinghuensis]RAJ75539.1 hypothetical protein CLV59_109153 [Chitinophaga dinghuensis]